jgi:hypothetical protein
VSVCAKLNKRESREGVKILAVKSSSLFWDKHLIILFSTEVPEKALFHGGVLSWVFPITIGGTGYELYLDKKIKKWVKSKLYYTSALQLHF